MKSICELAPRVRGIYASVIMELTLMRLSYTFEVNTPSRQRIFDSILFNNGVDNHCGNLSIDTPIDRLYEGILQFAGCVQKVCNMRYWTKETVRSAFYDDLNEYVTNGSLNSIRNKISCP